MKKSAAIKLLGGSLASLAGHVGCSYQAAHAWPEDLPPRIADRVLAAQARRFLAPHLIGDEEIPPDPAPRRSGERGLVAQYVTKPRRRSRSA